MFVLSLPLSLSLSVSLSLSRSLSLAVVMPGASSGGLRFIGPRRPARDIWSAGVYCALLAGSPYRGGSPFSPVVVGRSRCPILSGAARVRIDSRLSTGRRSLSLLLYKVGVIFEEARSFRLSRLMSSSAVIARFSGMSLWRCGSCSSFLPCSGGNRGDFEN